MPSMFMFLLTMIVFLFFIGLFVIAHELGHFFFARRAGILCHEFAVGMGPVVYKKKKGETTFSIRLLPIGGYVQMATDLSPMEFLKKGNKIGLNLEEGAVNQIIVNDNMDTDVTGYVEDFDLSGQNDNNLYITLIKDGKVTQYPVLSNAFYVFSESSQIQIAPYNRTFESKTVGQRVLTLVFGPIMNFVAAFLIYIIFWAIMGVPNTSSNVIGAVIDNNPASHVLQAGDEILYINDYAIETWSEGYNSVSAVMDRLAQEGTERVQFVVRRNGQIINDLPIIYNNIILNSIGLTNIGITDHEVNEIAGIRVGNVLHNHVSRPSSNEVVMQIGDILTGIRVDVIQGNTDFEDYKVDGWIDIYSWSRLTQIVSQIDVARINYRFSRVDEEGNKTHHESVTPIESWGTELLNNQRVRNIMITVGISAQTHFSFFGMFTSAADSFVDDFTLIFRTLQLLVAPSGFRQVGVGDLSGPVGIFGMIGTMMERGILPLLAFVAMLSVNFGIINLLPIPALDGGRLVFLGYEAVTKKKPNKNVEATLTTIVFFLLMLLMIYVTFNDVIRAVLG